MASSDSRQPLLCSYNVLDGTEHRPSSRPEPLHNLRLACQRQMRFFPMACTGPLAPMTLCLAFFNVHRPMLLKDSGHSARMHFIHRHRHQWPLPIGRVLGQIALLSSRRAEPPPPRRITADGMRATFRSLMAASALDSVSNTAGLFRS